MGGGDRIGTLAMGFYCPTYVNTPTEGYPVWQPFATLFAEMAGPANGPILTLT